MSRKISNWLLATVLLATASAAQAQQPGKIARIGFISPSSSSSAAPNLEAFKEGLRELGYVDGKDVVIEVRWAEGSAERLAHLVAELIQLKVDILLVGGATEAIAAKNSGSMTPVVFAAVTDPLGYGRYFPQNSIRAWRGLKKFWNRWERRIKERNPPRPTILSVQDQLIIDTARDKRLPTMFFTQSSVVKGGLASYSVSRHEMGRLSAKYVQRILTGVKPQDLPVQGVDKIELFINLKTAKQIGLTIPPNVLARADKVIN